MIFWLLNFDNFLLQYDVSSFEWFWNIENEKMEKRRTIYKMPPKVVRESCQNLVVKKSFSRF